MFVIKTVRTYMSLGGDESPDAGINEWLKSVKPIKTPVIIQTATVIREEKEKKTDRREDKSMDFYLITTVMCEVADPEVSDPA